MTLKLFQKHLFKGTQEFEIIEDTVVIKSKSPFKREETLTVMLTVLNAEPVIDRSSLHFTSRVNSEPLVSLYLGKPDTASFNAFVGVLKQKIQDEFNAFSGLKRASSASHLSANEFEAPVEFDESGEARREPKKINPEQVEDALRMLGTYMNLDEIEPFVATLKALKEEPDNADRMVDMVKAFNQLGPRQGAVLSYAPSMITLLSDDPYSR
jgi:hypothetical protein